MSEDIQYDLLPEYVTTSLELIEGMETGLMLLEKDLASPSADMIRELQHQLHTLKGNSGIMGFARLSQYIHRLEDLVKAVQTAELAFDGELLEVLFRGAAVLRQSVSGLSPEHCADPTLARELCELDEYLNPRRPEEDAPAAPPDTGEPCLSMAVEAPAQAGVLRVDFAKLDQLMNLMGELLIQRTRLCRLESQFKQALGKGRLSLEYGDALRQMTKVSTELHEAIMKVRMLPLDRVFRRFPRFVRDFARRSGKEVNLIFQGEDTEVDKTIIDQIGEPLTHLIRNALDHGLEMPAEREELGKSRAGRIVVGAAYEDSRLVITVEDDGRGVDEEKVLAKARRLGMADADLPGDNPLDLIFQPGLSTAQQVTELSGRGVGLDAVKKSIAKMNGAIEVSSLGNLGTKFTIRLPLTLAILPVLLASVGGETYAVPMLAITESVKIKPDDIHLVNGSPAMNWRDQVMPLVELARVFNPASVRPGQGRLVVVVKGKHGPVGLLVDKLVGRQEIVVKPLDEAMNRPPGIVGSTLLGDGKVILILDLHETIALAANQGQAHPGGRAA